MVIVAAASPIHHRRDAIVRPKASGASITTFTKS
jgi:hypothetical protein